MCLAMVFVMNLSFTLVSHHGRQGGVYKFVIEPPTEVGEDVDCSNIGEESPLLEERRKQRRSDGKQVCQRGWWVSSRASERSEWRRHGRGLE